MAENGANREEGLEVVWESPAPPQNDPPINWSDIWLQPNHKSNVAAFSQTNTRPVLSQLPVPQYWDANDKSKTLFLCEHRLRVSYKGPGKYDNDAAAIRAERPIPPACGLFYFEILVVSKGRDGHIGIGLSAANTPLNRLPGWDQHSYGYHGDDGFLFRGSGGSEYGPTFSTGDTIGCCINFRSNTVFYTKNGMPLNEAFRGILNEPLFPTIGLRTPGEVIEANFGQKPFLFDFLAEAKRERAQMLVDAQLHSSANRLGPRIPEMILQFLIHHGHKQTAEIFARSIRAQPSTETLASIDHRQKLTGLILEGDIRSAMEILEKHHSECLHQHKDLQFQLKYHRFIQMIQTETPEATILYGRRHFSFDDPLVLEHQQTLDDVFSLLAYPNPSESPVAFLLTSTFRQSLATAVNSAILESHGQNRVSTLERCFAHSDALIEALVEQEIPAAALCDSSWLISSDPMGEPPKSPESDAMKLT